MIQAKLNCFPALCLQLLWFLLLFCYVVEVSSVDSQALPELFSFMRSCQQVTFVGGGQRLLCHLSGSPSVHNYVSFSFLLLIYHIFVLFVPCLEVHYGHLNFFKIYFY